MESPTAIGSVGDITLLLDSFLRHLRARNLSAKTLEAYGDGCRQFAAYLSDKGMPTAVASIRREHVEAWMEELLRRWKPATASNRYRALQAFFKWLVDEGEIDDSPTIRMVPPKVPEELPAVFSDRDVRDLLATCTGNGFEDRRDAALLRSSSTRVPGYPRCGVSASDRRTIQMLISIRKRSGSSGKIGAHCQLD